MPVPFALAASSFLGGGQGAGLEEALGGQSSSTAESGGTIGPVSFGAVNTGGVKVPKELGLGLIVVAVVLAVYLFKRR